MTYYRAIFLFLSIINLSLQQCSKTNRMKWCIHNPYRGADGNIVNRDSCTERPCIVGSCPYGQMNKGPQCLSMGSLASNFSEFTALYRLDPKSGMPVKTNKTLDNTRFQFVTYTGEPKKPYLRSNNNCTSDFKPIEKGHFLEDGSFLLLPKYIIVPAGEYIVRFINDQKLRPGPRLLLKYARDQRPDDFEQSMDKVIAYAMLVSCLFMILLLVVYVLCKDLRTTAGLILMTYVAVFAITFLLISTRELAFLYKMKLSSTSCFIISALIHFFIFSSYFWMNIMGFDIWWTLRTMYYHGAGGRRGVDHCKYWWYCGIASVPPLIYVIIEVCLEVFTDYGPKFKQCSVCLNKWYEAGVVLPLQAFNFIPFVLTIFNLWRIQKSTRNQLNNSCSGNTGPARQNALLSIKISVMMGTNWFVDVLLLIFVNYSWPDWFRNTAKLYNALFGVILFVVYIFKWDVLLRLFRRLSINNGITRHLERRVSRQHGSHNKSRKYSVQSSGSSATALQTVNSLPDTDNTEI